MSAIRNITIDSQFTLDRIADLEGLRRRREKAARDAIERYRIGESLAYSADPDERLWMAFPERCNALVPVLIFIHGGFWSMSSGIQFAFLANGFVPHGIAIALIDYPLMPRVRLGDVISSCQRAAVWLRDNSRDFGIDPERIHVSGNSAGGHLVAELMDTSRLTAAGLPTDLFKSGAAVSGMYDLRPVAASFRNDVLQLSQAELLNFSPLLRPLNIAMPLLLTVGGDETEIFIEQAEAFAGHMRRARANVQHLIVPGADHITINLDHLAKPHTQLNEAVCRQILC